MATSVFIGSSTEGLEVARAIQFQLRNDAQVTVWDEGVFPLGQSILESIVNLVERFDFAVLVLSPDDLILSREVTRLCPRDNVMFELGLFIGRLGRARTFMVYDSSTDLQLPSELAGTVSATYDGSQTNKITAVGPACVLIRNTIKDLGVFEGKSAQRLQKAANQVENISETIARLIHLLARSRAVELDIIKSQFGMFISTEFLDKIKKDLDELEASTNKGQHTTN